MALKQQMGLIAAPEAEAPRQLESGDDAAAEAGAAVAEDAAEDAAEVAEATDGGAASPAASPAAPPAPNEPVVHEAQLIEEFDKLENRE